MANPVLVEVTRGAFVESRHRGALAVVDADGGLVAALGDIEAAVFPRSAIKLLQAIPLIESGAAERYGFGDAELALACSSHNGEARHVAVATAMLAAAGCADDDLECGAQIPTDRAAADALVRAGLRPMPIHNNCSGKHAGFICTACHAGIAPSGYVAASHPVQQGVAEAVGALTDTRLEGEGYGIDGCSIPTWPIPLRNLAQAFARIAAGTGMSPSRARVTQRLMAACFAEPFLVAGTGRFDTAILSALPGRAFVKGGAEGVAAAALPELQLGIFVKIDDGAGRAADVALATAIAALLPLDAREAAAVDARRVAPVLSRRGVAVGEIRAADDLAAALGAGRRVS